jgi:hypothetical protein
VIERIRGLSLFRVSRTSKIEPDMGSSPHRQGKVQPQPRQDRTAKARAASIKARKARADARAAEVAPIIAGLWAAGVTSVSDIAEALNERGVRTPTGKLNWHPVQVRLLLARLK